MPQTENNCILAPKLQVPFQGPYLVLDKVSDLDYCIQLDAKGKQKVVNHDNLNLYTGTGGLSWSLAALKGEKK